MAKNFEVNDMPSAAIAEQLHQLIDQLTNPHSAGPLKPGDLVQIHPDSDDAYRGLPGIVQNAWDNKARVSILRPHRNGMPFQYSLALLSKIGIFRANANMGAWSRQVEAQGHLCRMCHHDAQQRHGSRQLMLDLVEATRKLAAVLESAPATPKIEIGDGRNVETRRTGSKGKKPPARESSPAEHLSITARQRARRA